MVQAQLGTVTDAAATAARAAPARTERPGRIIAIDVARAVAVVGMLVVNSGPTDLNGPASQVWALAHGRASLLFVLLAGVSVSLLARGRPELRRGFGGTLMWRAGLLLAIGVALVPLDHGAQVILPTYALLFVLALGLVRLRTRWLAVVAGTLTLLGPVAVLLTLQASGEAYEREKVAVDDGPANALVDLLLSGPYPLVTWTVPFVLGMALGRLDLRATRVQVAMAALGAATALVAVTTSYLLVAALGEPTSRAGFDHLVVTTAHSQMPLWLLGGTAAGVLILGLCLLVQDRLGRLLWPLVVTGQLALTIYVGHLLVLHLTPDGAAPEVVGVEVPLALVLSAAAVLGACLWRSVARYGPLEVLMRPPWVWRTARASATPVDKST